MKLSLLPFLFCSKTPDNLQSQASGSALTPEMCRLGGQTPCTNNKENPVMTTRAEANIGQHGMITSKRSRDKCSHRRISRKVNIFEDESFPLRLLPTKYVTCKFLYLVSEIWQCVILRIKTIS